MSDLLDQLLNRPAWHADAACNGSDTPQTAFFPGQNTGSNATAAARRLCNGCLVRTECLDFALANQIEFGVWGGTSENQRRTLRRTARLGGAA